MLKILLKLISIALIVTLILTTSFVLTNAFADTAIAISTKEEFNNIRNNLSGNYYLTCDIEFSASDFASGGNYYNSGKCFLPIGDGKTPFTGTFDGRGYTVSGIKINVYGSVYSMSVTPVNTGISTLSDDGWTGDYIIPTTPKLNISPAVGVFGSNKGIIKNLNLSDCSVSARSSNSATLYVGGVVGHNNGSILNCSSQNTLNCDAKSYIGGIAGYQSGGKIENSFVRSKIESEGVFGGIAGAVAGGEVSACYSEAAFTGTAAAAFGMVGVDVVDSLDNCYYISNSDCDGVGERISVADAKNPKAYTGFDFNNSWYMSGTLRRPALKGVGISEGEDITMGDLNADKNTNLLDLVLLAQHVAEWQVEIHSEVSNVDFNFTAEGEDIVDLQDVTYLAKNLAGWSDAIIY